MRKHRIWYGVLLAAAVFLAVLANRREAALFLAGLILIPVALLVLQILAGAGTELDCQIPAACRAGDSIPLTIVMKRKNRIPMGKVGLCLQFENLMFGEKKTQFFELIPREKMRSTYSWPVEMPDCGSVRITLLYEEYRDLTGIFSKRRKKEFSVETLVYPAQIQLETSLTRRPETRTTGEYYDPYRHGQDVSEAAGIRDYIPGDHPGSIHWKLSSKLDNLVVREFAYPSDYNVIILYDMMKQADETPVANIRNDAVLALTVALSSRMLELNLEHNVSRIMQGEYQTVPVWSTETHERMMLNLLCKPIAEAESRGDALYYFLRSNLKNEYTKMIYITPEYDETYVRQLSSLLDITVLQVVQGTETALVENPGYVTISVDAEKYREQQLHILI